MFNYRSKDKGIKGIMNFKQFCQYIYEMITVKKFADPKEIISNGIFYGVIDGYVNDFGYFLPEQYSQIGDFSDLCNFIVEYTFYMKLKKDSVAFDIINEDISEIQLAFILNSMKITGLDDFQYCSILKQSSYGMCFDSCVECGSISEICALDGLRLLINTIRDFYSSPMYIYDVGILMTGLTPDLHFELPEIEALDLYMIVNYWCASTRVYIATEEQKKNDETKFKRYKRLSKKENMSEWFEVFKPINKITGQAEG